MPRILIVEDDPAMQNGLRDNLEIEGYEVDVEGDGEKGLQAALHVPYDLIILDVMLPKMSGIDILRKAREANVTARVVMLTARGEEIDKVLGLELGADDYVTKPFSLRELLARVKALLRRYQNSSESGSEGKLILGDLQIDFSSYTARKGNEPCDMTPKEFDVLRFMWEHEGQTVSRTLLLEKVWGYDDSVSSRTVDNVMVKLRQKIEEDPARPRHILTMHGLGYKFVL